MFPLELRRESSYDSGGLWNGKMARVLEADAAALFRAIDINGDNRVTREEFVTGLTNAPNVDLFEAEAGRLFDCVDTEAAGFVDEAQFIEAATKMRWLRSLIRLYIAGFEYQFTFVVAPDYDYHKPTCENYKADPGLYFGPYAHIRKSRDYSYHMNYTEQRQRWQDQAVRASIGKTDPQTRPWMVFTCGSFGAGKGHVLSWLSNQGLFPLEYIVHIDPDFFKRVMPEWKGYLSNNVEFAGTATHRESGYIQEIATEAALRERQHIWVDGSLKDYEWHRKFFEDLRQRYRHYRLAIIHVSADEDVLRARIKKRGEQTGRMIPEEDILSSLVNPDISIRKLAHLCDLVVRFRNNGDTPRLLSVEDHSGNLQRGLYRHFGVITRQLMPFPQGLGPLFFENTAMIGNPFKKIGEAISYQPYFPEFEGCLLVKESTASQWTPCVARLSNRILTCSGASLKASEDYEEPLWRCEITERTVVKLHDEYHFSPRLNAVKRDINGNEITREKIHADERLRFSFYVNRIDADNNISFLEFATPVDIARMSWKQHIELTKYEYRRKLESGGNSTTNNKNCITEWKVNFDSMAHSYNINTLLALKGAIKLKSTSPCERPDEREQSLSNIPDGATHFRWFYPNYELKNTNLGCDIKLDDPDVIFLLSGGFAYYDAEGNVLGALALATRDTEYFMHFGEPRHLSGDDANRLHSAGRWIPTTVEKIRQAGALFFTFLHPNEELSGGTTFPPLGCFAYLFRDPSDPPDERDRYFPILPIE